VTKRSLTKENAPTNESLVHLIMSIQKYYLGFNRLEAFDVMQTDFPKLANVALRNTLADLGYNNELKELDLTGF
jgi:hypothetical protein